MRMKLGIVADIHGNDVALRAVLPDARRLEVDRTGLPRTCGTATWLLLEDDGDDLAATHRSVPFDVDAVAGDLPAAAAPQCGVRRRDHHRTAPDVIGRRTSVTRVKDLTD
jgi:hypothetical protein